MMVPKTNLDPPITRDYFVRDGQDRMLKKTSLGMIRTKFCVNNKIRKIKLGQNRDHAALTLTPNQATYLIFISIFRKTFKWLYDRLQLIL